jgi:hypothetical protein
MCKTQHDKIKALREKERTTSKSEIVQFLYDGMRMSSLDVRIKKVATSRLRNRGIGSVSAMTYL